MASVNNYAIVDVPFSHNGTGTAGNYIVAHTYRTGCTHVPVIDLGTGNATHTTLALNTPDSGIVAANDAKHTVCVWASDEMNIQYNGLLSLDISAAKMLTNIRCAFNKLVALDFTNNTELEELRFYENPELITANVSGLPNMTKCFGHLCQKLTTIGITNSTALTDVQFNSTALNDAGVAALVADLDAIAWPVAARTLNISFLPNAANINTGTTCDSLGNLAAEGWVITYEQGTCTV